MSDRVNDPALEVRGLSHRFKNHQALDGVEFTVARESIHGFVGPNGAGKTTTLKIVGTLLPPQTGDVRVIGHDVVRETNRVRARIGFMPDHFSMYRQMTVHEYLDFFAAAYGIRSSARGKVIDDVLLLTDMDGRRDDLIRGLSRGMQQRVSLARVLVNDPELLLLDEPASGLDPRARIELMEILRELRRMGKTVFISSHILSELADLCDSVTIIDRGTVRYSGAMEDLLVQRGDTHSYVIGFADACPAAESALRGAPGVRALEATEEEPHGLRIDIDANELDTGSLLGTAIAAGATIVSFRESRRHLNQAFLDLTEPGVR
ncbi:MAG: ABC transporter ATP-binding protein [Planctomycetes bacterium]|nr:ABC transporter ATP-binding protein [Planctomycetota bacterium]